MPRYHLTIEYDGSQLRGWQRQKIIPTGQKILEQAIDDYCQEDVTLVAAGRTDAGVHALGQSVHVDLQLNRSCRDITRGLNAHLRNTPLVVLSVRQVSPTFHARFDALRRHYCYVVCCRLAPPLLWRGRAWHQPFSLNLQAMEEAASMMEGLHDFFSFPIIIMSRWLSYPYNRACANYAFWRQRTDDTHSFSSKSLFAEAGSLSCWCSYFNWERKMEP